LVTGHSAARQVAPALARSAGQRPPARDGLEWRSAVMADDVGRVRSLVASTGFFNAAEVDVAADLVTERLAKGIRSGYHFILAERGSGLVAYACYGPIEGTQGSFDLYWIAVAPEEQRKGLGPQVFARAESAMRKAGAKKIYVDTSSSDRYAGTRGFYQRMGFAEDARLLDFYGPGDSKVIYVKELAADSATSPK
jgi:GNAT superfamily N-acetyltransferase